ARGRDVSARRRHAVIVDDERLARRELRTLLEEAHGDQVHIVGEAASVAEAARLVNATDADVVFLDIQLTGETGMDLLPLLGVDVDVVFVTAYDAYTLRAFEVNAVDYLLKPVAPERLAVTVNRLAASQPPAPSREAVTYADRLLLRLGEERVFVRVRDIVAIEADGDGSNLLLAPQLTRKPSSKSLREWEQRLPDRHFVRIHRSTIVNLEYVERLEPWSHASQHVYLRGLSKPLTMSRRFGARLRDRFG
ncbi:MAG TPA: LytTR family DNA-binding domain-containing protein, partial [Gemmatimonadaceae bacterium]|nr:LytTR family DNA-binding domain-containing protein [Gemmatimonadaceae bacterium]